MRDTPGNHITLPPCGMFIGTGVYPMSADCLVSTLLTHQSWTPQRTHPTQMLDRIIEDNQGNLAQLWGYARGYAPAMLAEWIYALDEIGVEVKEPNWETGEHLTPDDCPQLAAHADRRGAGLVRFVQQAAERGLWTVFIYTDATPEWSAKLTALGDRYLGYDFGERFTFQLDDQTLQSHRLEDITLPMLAEGLLRKVRQHVQERRSAGWGNILATSSNFHVDYEIAAGADIPLVEDFAFRHLNMASALSRGLYRQFDLPLWGSHMAHEHYSWIPLGSKHKFALLEAAMYQKYMAGCKMIINESGNWFVEASLCEDSPRFEFPTVPLSPTEVTWGGKPPLKFIPYIKEARRYYNRIDYTAEPCRRYRQVTSDFYNFVKANGTPEGQPQTTLAIAKGNYDLCNHTFSPNNAVAGAYSLAELNPAWFEAAPEMGWNIVKDVFYPTRPVLGPYPNHFLSGTPYGLVDIVTFAEDRIDADFLVRNYKALLFAGWNTSSARQYDILTQYVRNGGTLFLSIPHLSTNVRRNYTSYSVDELVHGGDFSELCGVRVRGPGERFYWATAPRGSDELGFTFPRRFGFLCTRIGDIDITDPNAESLVVDDEMGKPVLLRRRCGKGQVYFLNSWAYPGAMNTDDGPGARVGSKGLIGTIFQHIARQARGRVWISPASDADADHCEYVAYSYFPQGDTICLHNVDLDRPRRFTLHLDEHTEAMELQPGQFLLRHQALG
jgi:hypothetical protein